ncbi:YlqD family protein [Brevibacillus dissolubilis]|uniref:YlqD family protein n=1 Tax=Brevibacillus dissolubilis TaxID=1844116 RepID=UPI0011171B22|nr:YlqD family protein [Brevibacillus dissolubilis]
MITIHRPIQVKIILTETSRRILIAEYERQIRQLEQEQEQWQFQGKKLLVEAQKKSPEIARIASERIAKEERNRAEKLELLHFQLRQAESLPEGSEIHHSTVQSPVQIKTGDAWDEIMSGTEILLKDGVVFEIRQGGIKS